MSSTRIDRNAWSADRVRRNWQRLAQATANPLIKLNPSSTNALYNTSTGYGVFVDNSTIFITPSSTISTILPVVYSADNAISTSTNFNSTRINLRLDPGSTNVLSITSSGLLGTTPPASTFYVFSGDASISTSTGGTSTKIFTVENPSGGLDIATSGLEVKLSTQTVAAANVVAHVAITSTNRHQFTQYAVGLQLGSTTSTNSTNVVYAIWVGNLSFRLYQGSTQLQSTSVSPPASTTHILSLSTAGGSTLVQINGSTILGPKAYTVTSDPYAGFFTGDTSGNATSTCPLVQFAVMVNGINAFTDNFPGTYTPDGTKLHIQNPLYISTGISTDISANFASAWSVTQAVAAMGISTQGLLNTNTTTTNLNQGYRYTGLSIGSTTILPLSGLAISSTGLGVVPDNATIQINSAGELEVKSGSGGVGTVTSVGLDLPSTILSTTGSPVTSNGTLTGTLITQISTTFFGGPSTGTAATPTFRAIQFADMTAASTTISAMNNGISTSTSGRSTTLGTRVSASTNNLISTLADGLYASTSTGTVFGPSSATDRAIAMWNGSTGTLLQDSNIVIDSTGMIVVGGFIGSELITNGTFNTDLSTWSTTASAWYWTSTSGGVAHASTAGILNQNPPIVIGGQYRVSWTVKNWVSGGLQVGLGGQNFSNEAPTSSGTRTYYVSVNATTGLNISASGSANFDVDDVSVERVTLPNKSTYVVGGITTPQFGLILGDPYQAIMRTIPDGTLTGGNLRGVGASDFQTIRTAANQVASGIYSFAAGESNVVAGSDGFATGANNTQNTGTSYCATMGSFNVINANLQGATAIGVQNNCATNYSLAVGRYAQTDHLGEFAHAMGSISPTTKGLNQAVRNLFYGFTSTSTETEIFIDGSSTNRFSIGNSTAYSALVHIMARKAGGTGAGFKRHIYVERNGGASTTNQIGSTDTWGTDINSSTGIWGVRLAVNSTTGTLDLFVTGSAGDNIRWAAMMDAIKLVY